jgi:hypothetical protein
MGSVEVVYSLSAAGYVMEFLHFASTLTLQYASVYGYLCIGIDICLPCLLVDGAGRTWQSLHFVSPHIPLPSVTSSVADPPRVPSVKITYQILTALMSF